MNRVTAKLTAIALAVVVIASGLGYWLLIPKTPSESVSPATQQTSLTSSSRTQVQSWTTSTVTSSTTLAETVQWINVSAGVLHPVSYYLKLLEWNGTQPYVQLAKELRKLPDLTNATAVANITYLALNATNPEVKEAFELMMKGGTPSQSDFTYTVPKYNTELQVLYWLASQNEFKKDDTLALAVAMVNGLWVTMGDQQVREAVKEDVSDLLDFFRETNELQKLRGYYPLEQYPLEAKVALAWTGNDTPTHGPYALGGPHYARKDFRRERLDLLAYRWNNVATGTLRNARNVMGSRNWINSDVGKVVANLEEYFWFRTRAWIVGSFDMTVSVGQDSYSARNLNNANFELEYFLAHGKGIGVCEDRMVLLDTFCKSWGISTVRKLGYWSAKNPDDPKLYSGHTHILYFEPGSKIWTAYQPTPRLSWGELLMGEDNVANETTPIDVYVLKLPVIQENYLGIKPDSYLAVVQSPHTWSGELNNAFHAIYNTTLGETFVLFSKGVSSAQMKQWLLYS